MSRNKAINCRNEVKSYITREGMTMTEVVELLADEHGWSSSVPNLSGKLRRGRSGTPRRWSWPMCWATIWFGRSAGRCGNIEGATGGLLKKYRQIPRKPVDFFGWMYYTLFQTNALNEEGNSMANYTQEQWNAKKIELMETCFNGFADLGLHGTGIRTLAKHCGYNTTMIYTYFEDLDDLIIQSTEYCMSKVEDEFMAKAPTDVEDLWRFIDEIPYWTAQKHGKKYRLMYQVYTHPRYREYGQKFFQGVDQRYTEYAKSLESKLGIPYQKLTPLIFILIRACVHYALFEDEFYLKSQIAVLKETIELFIMKYNTK